VSDQFLDLGSGIPTVGNVHEVAQAVNPIARVVYVDIDSITVAHAQILLRNQSNAVAVRGDLRQPEQILADPTVRTIQRLEKPLAIVLLASLHFVIDDVEAESVTSRLRNALAPAGYLVITQAYDSMPLEGRREMEALSRTSGIPLRVRTRTELERYFAGLELVEPGVVYLPLRRPESSEDVFMEDPPRSSVYAGVGRVPDAY
jgi:SAM-dependent methyltransferase